MIYIDSHVEAVRDLLGDALRGLADETEITTRLESLARASYEGHGIGHPGTWVLARNWHPELGRLPLEAFREAEFSMDDARLVVARDHGFTSFDEVDGSVDQAFEAAVDAVVTGDRDALMAGVGARPQLVLERSGYGHGATLLHYVAANAVEIHRQTVPENAVEITQLLLATGADPRALLKAYGGEYGPLAMLQTSGHPQAAGVAPGIEALLVSAGAL